MKHRLKIALEVLLIAGVSVAVAHLVSALVNPAASPVVILGTLVIELTPNSLKEFAIATFGDKDKIVLIGTILAVVAMATAAIGAIWARKRTELKLVVLLFSALPLMLSFLVQKATLSTFLPSLALIAVAYFLLRLFLDVWNQVPYSKWDELDGKKAAEDAVGRRALLAGAAGLAILGALAGAGGQRIIQAKTTLANIRLPRPSRILPKKVSGIEGKIPGITPLVTPVKDFYRVDVNLTVPVVDQNTWALEVKRDGYKTKRFTYDDLLKMELVERDITLVCVSNTVGGKYAGSGRWLGVDLATLLAGFDADDGKVDQIFSTSTDGYTCSTPLKYALDGRESMVAVALNGEPLPRIHGFPARLLVPGLFGFIGATKWLKTIELTTYDRAEAYWTKRDWATDAPIKPQARIDVPASFASVKTDTVVAGVAWAGVRGVRKVEVSMDGGDWLEATIDVPRGGTPEPGETGALANDSDYWVQWYLAVDGLPQGRHEVRARCVTKDGETQTEKRANSFPDGASGWASKIFTAK